MSASTLCFVCLALPSVAGDGLAADNDRLTPGLYPVDPVLASNIGQSEAVDPFFEVDWSLGLRGSYTSASTGDRFDSQLTPTIALEHIGSRSVINISGEAELIHPQPGSGVAVSGLRLNLQGGYNLDRYTRLTGTGNLSRSQPIAGSPGVANNLAEPAREVSGGGELGISRQFGKFNAGLTGGVQRTTYGPSTLIDGTVVDNTDRDYWSYDSTLRLGYQWTPVFEVFGKAGIDRDIFDRPSSSLLVKDATNMSLVAGVTGRWSNVLQASASTGVSLRRFDEASLGEVISQLYDASLTLTPDPVWRLRAGLSTIVAPSGPNSGGTGRVNYVADGEIGYTVNSWLSLHAFARWNQMRFSGSADSETGHGWGLGADYQFNTRTALAADYGYTYSESTSNGTSEAHRVTLGMTVAR